MGGGGRGGEVMVVGGLRDRVDLHSLELINIAFARGYQKVLSFRICSTHVASPIQPLDNVNYKFPPPPPSPPFYLFDKLRNENYLRKDGTIRGKKKKEKKRKFEK